jgi:hypothetical protein
MFSRLDTKVDASVDIVANAVGGTIVSTGYSTVDQL